MHLSQPHGSRTVAIRSTLVGSACSRVRVRVRVGARVRVSVEVRVRVRVRVAMLSALVGSAACSVMPDVRRRDSAGGESGSASAAPSPPAGVGILTESADMPLRANAEEADASQDSAVCCGRKARNSRASARNRNPLRDRDLANTLLKVNRDTKHEMCERYRRPSALLRH